MNNFTDVGVVIDVMGVSILQDERSTSSDSKVYNLLRLAIWEGPKIPRLLPLLLFSWSVVGVVKPNTLDLGEGAIARPSLGGKHSPMCAQTPAANLSKLHILGLYRDIYRDNGKENGNYYSIGFRV